MEAQTESLVKGKEIAKACLLALLLIPLVVFGSGMASGLLADPIVAGKDYHRPKDVAQEVVFAAMTMSLVAGVGLMATVVPLARFPPPILPRWVAALIGVTMLGFIVFGNQLYHHHYGGSLTSLYLVIFLLTAPPSCAAGFVLRFACARQPAGKSLIRPLLWAFGSILASSAFLALVTVFIGGIPAAELPTR